MNIIMKLLFDIKDPVGLNPSITKFVLEAKSVFENDTISIITLANHYLSISKFNSNITAYSKEEIELMANIIVSGILSHLLYHDEPTVWSQLFEFYKDISTNHIISWYQGVDILIEKSHMRQ